MDLSQEILKQLIKIKSYSGQENELANFIMVFCKKNDLPVEKQDNNIIVKYLTGSKKCLIFNAHMDTVKEGNPLLWKFSPFGEKSGIIKDGKLYGLGASDDKGSIATLLLLALNYKNITPPIDIFFTFVTNEETNGAGTKSFINFFMNQYATKYTEVSAIIAEPTDCDFIEIGHRGNIFLKLKIKGDSGHSSNPDNIKIHSLEKMIKIIAKIKKLEKEIKIFYYDDILGYPTICLTGFNSSESSINKVPSECNTTWDIRTTPLLHDKFIDILKRKVGNNIEIELVDKPINYSLTEENSKIINIFKKNTNNLAIKIAKGSNDTVFFNEIGIPALTFGPGNKNTIHKENEYIEIKNINKAIQIYTDVIKTFK